MKIYYLQVEYVLGKHRIISCQYDKDIFPLYTIPFSLYYEMIVDEINPDNKEMCFDLKQTVNKIDDTGENKYHIEIEDELPVMYEKDGWEAIPEPEI